MVKIINEKIAALEKDCENAIMDQFADTYFKYKNTKEKNKILISENEKLTKFIELETSKVINLVKDIELLRNDNIRSNNNMKEKINLLKEENKYLKEEFSLFKKVHMINLENDFLNSTINNLKNVNNYILDVEKRLDILENKETIIVDKNIEELTNKNKDEFKYDLYFYTNEYKGVMKIMEEIKLKEKENEIKLNGLIKDYKISNEYLCTLKTTENKDAITRVDSVVNYLNKGLEKMNNEYKYVFKKLEQMSDDFDVFKHRKVVNESHIDKNMVDSIYSLNAKVQGLEEKQIKVDGDILKVEYINESFLRTIEKRLNSKIEELKNNGIPQENTNNHLVVVDNKLNKLEEKLGNELLFLKKQLNENKEIINQQTNIFEDISNNNKLNINKNKNRKIFVNKKLLNKFKNRKQKHKRNKNIKIVKNKSNGIFDIELYNKIQTINNRENNLENLHIKDIPIVQDNNNKQLIPPFAYKFKKYYTKEDYIKENLFYKQTINDLYNIQNMSDSDTDVSSYYDSDYPNSDFE